MEELAQKILDFIDTETKEISSHEYIDVLTELIDQLEARRAAAEEELR